MNISGLRYLRNAVSSEDADRLLRVLPNALAWQQPTLRLFGRSHRQPRLVHWMGDRDAPYRYSGTTHLPQTWHPLVSQLRDTLARQCQAQFNSVLINYYRDGQDCMGWHADDEPELGNQPIIASVSLGAPRDFRLRRRDRSRPPQSIRLEHRSLLIMSGSCQEDWQHCLPRRARVNSPRINLTFRRVLPQPAFSSA